MKVHSTALHRVLSTRVTARKGRSSGVVKTHFALTKSCIADSIKRDLARPGPPEF